jgi:hypothetical protein
VDVGSANRRVHDTTHEQVAARLDTGRLSLQPLDGRPPYAYVDDELRKAARDAYISWRGSRYSVPWEYVSRSVWVRDCGRDVGVHFGRDRIAVHSQALRKHMVLTQADHSSGDSAGGAGGNEDSDPDSEHGAGGRDPATNGIRECGCGSAPRELELTLQPTEFRS